MNDLDRDFSGFRGHWEPHSALIDFCEPNYVWTPYVAEFWNSVTAVGMFLIGTCCYFYCLPAAAADRQTVATGGKRKPDVAEGGDVTSTLLTPRRFIWGAFCLQSLGSAGLHMTLGRWWQKLDEIPMMICALACLYSLESTRSALFAQSGTSTYAGVESRNRRLLIGILCAGLVLLVVYEVFEYFEAFHALFTPIEFYCLGRCGNLCYLAGREPKSDFSRKLHQLSAFRRLALPGLALYGIAVCCWTLEMLACPSVRFLHTHAWAWHLLVALGFNRVALALELVRSSASGKDLEIQCRCFGTIPVLRDKRQNSSANEEDQDTKDDQPDNPSKKKNEDGQKLETQNAIRRNRRSDTSPRAARNRSKTPIISRRSSIDQSTSNRTRMKDKKS
ncbi:unnamed protein product [Amoebophrya sp. A25]|nr:unnamed protein product [Amoebophrya sp. A25]|eukprot:GSA25T00017615001.1